MNYQTTRLLKLWLPRKAEIAWLYFTNEWSQMTIAEYYAVHLMTLQRVMKHLGITSLGRGRRRGSTHHNFKNGLHVRDYRKIVTKDRCRKCGARKRLDIHHKNNDHYDNRLTNLEILCRSCHMSETKRQWWAAKKAGAKLPKSNGPVGWTRKPIA